jgi:hypothetical protein
MIRRLLMVTAIVLGWTVLGGGARSEDPGKKPAKPAKKAKAPFVHAVVFYLKKDAPKGEADALIADAHKMLAKIKSVRGLWAGRPAAKDQATPISKHDYDVGLLVLFDDADGLQEYLKDQLHLEFVKKHRKFLDDKKLTVFDFVNRKAAKKTR